MRLEDKAWQAGQSVREVHCLLGLVPNDFGAGELDTRLHHCANRSGERCLEAGIPESLFVNLDRPQRRFRFCHLKSIKRVLRSARYWDFDANNVDRRGPFLDERIIYCFVAGADRNMKETFAAGYRPGATQATRVAKR